MKQKIFMFIKRHCIKLLLLVLILNPMSLTFLIIVFGLIQDSSVSGLSYAYSSYIGSEVKIAPFAGFDKTLPGGFGSHYISTRAIAANSFRDSEEVAPPLGEYVNLKVYDVKLRSSGLFRISQICLLNDLKNLKQIIFEDCVNLSKLEAVTKFFYEAENEIQQFGSAYVTFNEEYSYKIMKPLFEDGSKFTYKVSSRAELVELITPKNLGFDHYYWIMEEACPVLEKDRTKFPL